jgi:hypothetical protein
MVRQTIKNPSNLQIVWDDGLMLVFSFTAADGYETVNCGIVHLAPDSQTAGLQTAGFPSSINTIQNIIRNSIQIYGDPQTWVGTIKSAVRGRLPNIQIDYDDQNIITYTSNSSIVDNPPSFTMQVLYSLAG